MPARKTDHRLRASDLSSETNEKQGSGNTPTERESSFAGRREVMGQKVSLMLAVYQAGLQQPYSSRDKTKNARQAGRERVGMGFEDGEAVRA